MTDPAPRLDVANLPAPAEGILVTLFITVRKVARSRDFYSRVLGGTVVLDENPCMVKLSNSWIIMNPGGPPTPDKPGISVVDYQPGNTTSIFLNLRVADIQACYEEWKAKGGRVRHATDRPRSGDPLLPAGPGRLPHRGRPVHRPAARQARRKAPAGPPWLSSVTGRETPPASKPTIRQPQVAQKF
jgi:predicted enzyme related to lactoylglutathione lyase